MTTIIYADSAIKNPLPDTVSVSDIESGIYFEFDASSISVADGAPVTEWVGEGVAPLANRTLNTRQSTGAWDFPTFDADGGPNGTPAVRFDGGQRLRTTDASVTPYEGDYTIAMVCSGVAPPTGHVARFFGSTGTSQLTVQPTSNDEVYAFASGTSMFQVALPDGHFVYVCTVSADRVSGMTSDMTNPSSAAVTGEFTPGFTGFGVGASFIATENTGLEGTVSWCRMYSRALNDTSIRDLVSEIKTLKNIA